MIEILIKKLYRGIEKLGEYTKNYLPKGRHKIIIDRDVRINSLIVDKLYDFINSLNSWKVFFLVFSFYIFFGFISRVPILYPGHWVFGIGLIFLAGVMFFCSNKIGVKEAKRYEVNYDFWTGLFVIGLIGLIINYMVIGVPLFNPDLREHYHNPFWSISMVFCILGMIITFSKYRTKDLFLFFIIISSVLSVFSGFRTDFVLFVAPLVFFTYLKGDLKNKHLLFLALVFLIFIVGIKYIILLSDLSQSNVIDILLSRPGFTLYVLSALVKNVGIFGLTHGRLFSDKLILQFFGVPVIQFGDFVSEMVINMPRSHASSFVGPLYLEFGILGVLIISFMVGFLCELPQKIYKLTKNNFFLSLYSINLSILLVWIETGPIQYYLIFLFLGIGIWCLRKIK